MNTTFTDDQSSSDNHSEKYTIDEIVNMTFTSMVKSESLEDRGTFEASQERTKDVCDIYEKLDELFEVTSS